MKKELPKIVYVTNTRLPTEKAHGLATIKICEAFADLGYEVDVVAPLLLRGKKGNVFEYYNVKNNFNIFKVLTLDLMFFRVPEKFAYLIQVFSFSLSALIYSLIKYRKRDDVIFFSHDSIPLYFMSFISKNIFYDVHHFPGKNVIYSRLMKKASGFAVQTKWKVKTLEDEWGISPAKIVYWPNGTDVETFKLKMSKKEARAKLDLPLEGKIILYTGQLFDWKGVDTLIEATGTIKENAHTYIVGGSTKDVETLKENVPQASSSNITFVSFQPHERMPMWQRAADVLVLPNTGKQKVSLYYTSPMKLFEYMASGTPIVASNIPSITEILNDSNAFLAEPDDPISFAFILDVILKQQNVAYNKAKIAQEDVRKYTWKARAQKIGDAMNKL